MYKQIYLIRYLGGERSFKHEKEIFNNFMAKEFFDDASDVEKLYRDRLYELTGERPFSDENFDIHVIEYKEGDELEFLDELQTELFEQGELHGADDDVYDYFPDLIYAFEQICNKLGDKKFFNATIKEFLSRFPEFEESLSDHGYI